MNLKSKPKTVSRREFSKELLTISIICGISPDSLLAKLKGNSIPYNDIAEKILNDSKKEKQKLLELYNYQKIRNLSDEELQGQYNKSLKFLGLITDNKFKNFSSEKQIRKIKKISTDPLPELKKEDFRRGYSNNAVQAIKYGEFGTSLGQTMFNGGVCLASLLAAPGTFGVSGAVALASCTFFTLGLAFNLNTMVDMAGNKTRSRKTLEFNTIKTVTETSSLLNEVSNFDLNIDLPDFTLSYAPVNINETDIFLNQDFSLTESEFVNFIKEEIKKEKLFKSKEEFLAFIKDYNDKMANVQKEMLSDTMDAYERAEHAKQLAIREKSAFFQSVNNFVTTVMSRYLTPKENEVLSVLMNAGFQMAMDGAIFGPMAWATVGLNVASILIRKDSQSSINEAFNAIFEQLKHIQKQLEIINSKLDKVLYTQFEIISVLKDILEAINDNINNNRIQFGKLSDKLKTILERQIENEKTEYHSKVEDLNNRLRIGLKRKLINKDRKLQEYLEELFHIAKVELYKYNFTHYRDSPLDGKMIFEIVFSQFRYPYNSSLYDTIGIVPVLQSYDYIKKIGTPKPRMEQVYHPIEFFAACNNYIDWCIAGKLKKGKVIHYIEELLKCAESSKNILNTAAALEVLEEKKNQYERYLNSLSEGIFHDLKKEEEFYFLKEGTLFQKNKISLLSASYANQLHHKRKQIHLGAFRSHILDRNYFGILYGFQFLKNLTEVNYNVRSGAENFPIGEIGAQKKVKVELQNLLIYIDHAKKIEIKNVAFEYEASLIKVSEVFTEAPIGADSTAPKIVFWQIEDNLQQIWKDAINRAYIGSPEYPKIQDVIEDFDKWEKFDRFCEWLIEQQLKQNKIEFSKKIREKFIKENSELNGVGCSFMVLTKLNKLITSDQVLPYKIGYTEEIYNSNDLAKLIEHYSIIDIQKNQPEVFSRLKEIAAENTITYKNKEIKLNPDNWIDAMVLLIQHSMIKTINNSLSGCKPIENNDCEPFLADIINRLNWYKNKYLKLRS